MTVRDFQNAILQSEFTPTEKLVALCIAFHVNKSSFKARLKQSTIADETGLSERSVRRAIAALISAGFIVSQMTGRSSIFVLASGYNTGSVDRPPVAYQTGHKCPHRPLKKCPWNLDTEFSTKVEEEYKRAEARAKTEEKKQASS